MENPITGKLSTLISRLEKKRANFYPADWDADPLYEVICELRKIIKEAHGQKAAPPLRRVGESGQ
jgi:hypothetical protein